MIACRAEAACIAEGTAAGTGVGPAALVAETAGVAAAGAAVVPAPCGMLLHAAVGAVLPSLLCTDGVAVELTLACCTPQ